MPQRTALFRKAMWICILALGTSGWASASSFRLAGDKEEQTTEFRPLISYSLGFSSAKDGSTGLAQGPAGGLGFFVANEVAVLVLDATLVVMTGLSPDEPSYFYTVGGGGAGWIEALQKDLFGGFEYRHNTSKFPGSTAVARVGLLPHPGKEGNWGFELQYTAFTSRTSTKKFSFPTGFAVVKYYF